MKKYHIELTEEEQRLVDQIDFQTFDHETYLASKEPILALLSSLRARDAIPEPRWKYWIDPEYSIGGYKNTSNKETFERNGNVGDDVYTHPHFRSHYLPYLLFGADLPDDIIEAFETDFRSIGVDVRHFTSGDYDPVWKAARKQARRAIRVYDMNKKKVAKEFFKLCLDMGFDVYDAFTVRRAVMQVSR